MDWQIATAIINEAKAGGFESKPLPEYDDQRITMAQGWVDSAKEEYIKGGKHPTVIAILTLAGQLKQGNTAVADKTVEEPDLELTVADTYPRRSSGGLSESDEREADAFLERLPIPPEIEREPTPMPSDIHSLGDFDVRRLMGEYNAYLGRAKWLLANAQTDLANATHLRDSALRKAFKTVHEELVKKEQRPTKDVVTSFAEEDEKVIEWNEKIREHQNHVTSLKALVEIYGGNVDRLSREATLRQYEWERSR